MNMVIIPSLDTTVEDVCEAVAGFLDIVRGGTVVEYAGAEVVRVAGTPGAGVGVLIWVPCHGDRNASKVSNAAATLGAGYMRQEGMVAAADFADGVVCAFRETLDVEQHSALALFRDRGKKAYYKRCGQRPKA